MSRPLTNFWNNPESIFIPIWLIFFLLPFLHCGKRVIVRHYYLVEFSGLPPEVKQLPPLEERYLVNVLPVRVHPVYAQRRIAMRVHSNEIQYFVQHQWAANPELMFTELIRRYFAESKTFPFGLPAEYAAEPDFLLDTRLEALEVIPEGEKMYARLVMRFYLVDRYRGEILVNHHFERMEPLPERKLNWFARRVSEMVLKELVQFDRKIRSFLLERYPASGR